MVFNTKDPRWIQMREERLTAKWRKGETACNYCGREMWFSDFETIPSFIARATAGDICALIEPDHKKQVATLDHILPLSRGGTHDHINLTTMCAECNFDKGAKHPLHWIDRKFDAGEITHGRAHVFRKKLKKAIKYAEKRGRIIRL